MARRTRSTQPSDRQAAQATSAREKPIARSCSMFIGSSKEGLHVARALRSALDSDVEATVWNEGFFVPGVTFIESLLRGLARFDFAVLVMTADDLVESRGDSEFGPRDNLLFELGLFMGRLARERTFVLRPQRNLKLPSDLDGLSMLQYQTRFDNNARAAVGSAADHIRNVVRDLGPFVERTNKQVQDIRERQETTESHVHAIQVVIRGLVTNFEAEKLQGLAKEGPFMLWFHAAMLPELYRLDALRYIQTVPDRLIESIRYYDNRGEQFDLKDFVKITDKGREYLRLRENGSNIH